MIMILFILAGLSAGAITSTGLFALISSIKLINRYADVTGTNNYVFLYEEMIIAGATIGNIVSIFQLPVHGGLPLIIIFGLVSGIFIGTFFVCLAEMVKALPVFMHRTGIKNCIGFIVLSIALGKCIGQLFYYLKLYA
ncbi:MAG: stage V sporulation protein AB [Eubacteriales bacterium]|nr:stage V sporulation protein AB [Eubacteriales bacterium]